MFNIEPGRLNGGNESFNSWSLRVTSKTAPLLVVTHKSHINMVTTKKGQDRQLKLI